MCSRESDCLYYVYKQYLLAAVSPCCHCCTGRLGECVETRLLLGGGIPDIFVSDGLTETQFHSPTITSLVSLFAVQAERGKEDVSKEIIGSGLTR